MSSKRGVFSPIYVIRVVLLYVIVGVWVATATSGLPAFWHVDVWWNEPIVYQKLVIWTMLLGALGLIGLLKPAAGHTLAWLRPGALRRPPWPDAIPGSAGDKRTLFDVGLYAGFIGTSAWALTREGLDVGGIGAVLPHNASGLIDPVLLVAPLVLLLLCGLRDKTIFATVRAAQYAPALVAFYLAGHLGQHGFVDMIVMLKLLFAIVWIGAAFPAGLRLSWRDRSMVRVAGTALEIGAAVVLLFDRDRTIAIAAVCALIGLHVLVNAGLSPSVPLERNLLFGYAAAFLFLGLPNSQGYDLGGVSSPGLLAATIACLTFFPVLRNLSPRPLRLRQPHVTA